MICQDVCASLRQVRPRIGDNRIIFVTSINPG
jgi:hypothetical protein